MTDSIPEPEAIVRNDNTLFPKLPVLGFGLLCLGLFACLLLPQLSPPKSSKNTDSWYAESRYRRGHFKARLIAPDSPAGQVIQRQRGEDIVGFSLWCDNREGLDTILINTAAARLYDFTANAYPAVPADRLAPSVAETQKNSATQHKHTLAPGNEWVTTLYFRRREILPHLTSLLYFQITLDGAPQNLQARKLRQRKQ